MGALHLGTVDGAPFGFPSDRLTRHGVVLGMTGSGKTGLGVVLLEEIASAGIPVIAIDPKGDLANLALAFAEPDAALLEPWVDPEEARREGIDVAALAETTAARLREGRAGSGLDDARVRRFVEGTRVTIHTPGSASGVPVDVLGAWTAPAEDTDDETRRELVAGTVGSLLGLLGILADPLRDPRHVILSTLIDAAWREGRAITLEHLVVQLVDPPFQKVGVFPLETFFPRDQRMDLALELNGLLASPAFGAWRSGVPLDIDALLAREEGRTPVRVFWLAHLDESQRSFFVAMLLARIVAWVRRQPGTGALRALLWFDEVMGYLPPHPANPPTKGPVLTLMKQARAAGLGVVLCTQNPVDVDYKALSNAGTWWIGRLSTARDRARVLEGLQTDDATLASTIDGLSARSFLVRDVAESAPKVLRTRFAISYLRGPLTKRELSALRDPRSVSQAGPLEPARSADAGLAVASLSDQPPPSPKGYGSRWLDPAVAFSPRWGLEARPRRPDGRIEVRPAILARVSLTFDEGKDFEVHREEARLFFPLDPEPLSRGVAQVAPTDLLDVAPPGLVYAPLPTHLDEAAEIARLGKRIAEDLFRGETERMFALPALKLTSRGGEGRDAFVARARSALEDAADAEIAGLRASADKKLKTLEGRLAKLQSEVTRLSAAQQAKLASEVVHAGEALFSLFFGGRKKTLSSAMTKRSASLAAGDRLSEREDQVKTLERELYELTQETETAALAIRNRWWRLLDAIEERPVRLERNDIRIDELVIVWVPVTRPV